MGTGGGGGLRSGSGSPRDDLELAEYPRHARNAPRGVFDLARGLFADHRPAQEDLTRHIDADVNLPLDRVDLERSPTCLGSAARARAIARRGAGVGRPSRLEHRPGLSSSRPPRGETHERRDVAEEGVIHPAKERRGINIRRRR